MNDLYLLWPKLSFVARVFDAAEIETYGLGKFSWPPPEHDMTAWLNYTDCRPVPENESDVPALPARAKEVLLAIYVPGYCEKRKIRARRHLICCGNGGYGF